MKNDAVHKEVIDLAATKRLKAAAVVFIGSQSLFSDWIVRIAASEVEGCHVLRAAALADRAVQRLAREGRIQLAVVEARQAEEMVAFDAQNAAVHRPRHWAVAYEDVAQANAALALLRAHDRHDRVHFLPMNVAIQPWILMLKLAAAGQCVVPRELLAQEGRIDGAALPTGGAIRPALTRREREVLRLASGGRCNKSIAQHLGLSEHTVKLHMHHVIRKIGVSNRTGAASWYHSQREQRA